MSNGHAPIYMYIGIVIIGNHNVTDIQEARALSHNHSKIDIYSNSWGGNDNGKELLKIGTCTEMTLRKVSEKVS